MNIIVYSVIGIILLVVISFLFSYMGDARNKKGMNQLAALRRKFTLSGNTMPGSRIHQADKRGIHRDVTDERFNIFPANGDVPVL